MGMLGPAASRRGLGCCERGSPQGWEKQEARRAVGGSQDGNLHCISSLGLATLPSQTEVAGGLSVSLALTVTAAWLQAVGADDQRRKGMKLLPLTYMVGGAQAPNATGSAGKELCGPRPQQSSAAKRLAWMDPHHFQPKL